MILQNNQALVSSGACFNLGSIIIPPTQPRLKALITNTSRTSANGNFFGVALTENNAVVGFRIEGQDPTFDAIQANNATRFLISMNDVANVATFVTSSASLQNGLIQIAQNTIEQATSHAINFTGNLNNTLLNIVDNSFDDVVSFGAINLANSLTLNSAISIESNSFNEHTANVVATLSSFTNSLLIIDGNESLGEMSGSTAFLLQTGGTGSRVQFTNNFLDKANTGLFLSGTNLSCAIQNNQTVNSDIVTTGTSASIILSEGSRLCATGNLFDAHFSMNLSDTCLHLVGNTVLPTNSNSVFTIATSGSGVNVEAPADNLSQAGVESLNTGTFSPIVGSVTYVPVGTCGCP